MTAQERKEAIDKMMAKHCKNVNEELIFMLGLNLGMKISEEISAEVRLATRKLMLRS